MRRTHVVPTLKLSYRQKFLGYYRKAYSTCEFLNVRADIPDHLISEAGFDRIQKNQLATTIDTHMLHTAADVHAWLSRSPL
jgi:hypothetical protein